MTKFTRIAALLVFSGLALGVSTSANAAFSAGTQGFGEVGNPTINSLDINTATSFSLGTVVTNGSRTGDFLLLPTLTLIVDGPLDLSNPALFSLSNAAFGVFQAITITEVAASPSTRAFVVGGLFTGGTAFGTPSSPVGATVSIAFTQSGGSGGAISSSASITAAVPEPASFAMVGLGLAGLTGLSVARRRRLAA